VILRLIKAFKRRNLSEPSSVISDDNRQNNLLEKVKGKVCSPFCPTNTGKSLSSMIAENIHHQGIVFKDLDSPFSINEFTRFITI